MEGPKFDPMNEGEGGRERGGGEEGGGRGGVGEEDPSSLPGGSVMFLDGVVAALFSFLA